MTESDYVVIRPAGDLPPRFFPKGWDGLWIDRSHLASKLIDPEDCSTAVAVPTGRFEVRDDGAVAEVFEVRP